MLCCAYALGHVLFAIRLSTFFDPLLLLVIVYGCLVVDYCYYLFVFLLQFG